MKNMNMHMNNQKKGLLAFTGLMMSAVGEAIYHSYDYRANF